MKCVSALFMGLLISLSTSIAMQAHEKKVVYLVCEWPDRQAFNTPGIYPDLNHPLFLLKKRLADRGYTLKIIAEQQEIIEPPTYIMGFNLTPLLFSLAQAHPKEQCALFVWEPPVVMPYNYHPNLPQLFSKIFTWDDASVDNATFFKMVPPQSCLHMMDNRVDFDDKKLCTLINGFHEYAHPAELYTERVRVIEFFEQQTENDFDFYGRDWQQNRYKNYRGTIDDKLTCLNKYKFCICYENMLGGRGYITEKIIDCFIAGCVPVYLGPDNVTEYIPAACFIDRRKFTCNEEVYTFLKNITRDEYEAYITNIRAYLKSEQAQLFSAYYFATTVMRALNLN